MPRRTRLVLAATFLAWTVIGLWFATQAYFNPAFSMRPRWGEAVAINLVYYYLWALATPVVVFFANRFRFTPETWGRALGAHVLASIVVTAVHLIVCEIILRMFTSALYRKGPFLDQLETAFGINFHSSMATYWLVLAVWLAATYWRNATRLEAQLSRAQLDALKMQLNPHFLFNTLNSVSSLMYHDVDAADAMLARLSSFLRMTLDRPLEQEIPLGDEIDFIRRYLDIERVRFEERLRVQIELAPGTERALVPSLVLQPLVENAIHHGIAPREEGGAIDVRARRDGEWLRIVVHDDGIGSDEIRERVGLANTRSRLEQLYGKKQRLTYGKRGGFEVELLIPWRT